MLIEQAFGKILTTNAGIIALCPAARIFWPKAPQSQQTWPCVVYRTVSPVIRDPLLSPSGYSGLVRTRFRVFSSMKTESGFTQAKKLDAAVRRALINPVFVGTVVDDTVSPVEAVEIQGIFAHDNISGLDQWDEKTQIASVYSDYDVWHDE